MGSCCKTHTLMVPEPRPPWGLWPRTNKSTSKKTCDVMGSNGGCLYTSLQNKGLGIPSQRAVDLASSVHPGKGTEKWVLPVYWGPYHPALASLGCVKRSPTHTDSPAAPLFFGITGWPTCLLLVFERARVSRATSLSLKPSSSAGAEAALSPTTSYPDSGTDKENRGRILPLKRHDRELTHITCMYVSPLGQNGGELEALPSAVSWTECCLAVAPRVPRHPSDQDQPGDVPP